MLDIPELMLAYIQALAIDRLAPAYLRISKDGFPTSCGGNRAAYGLEGLDRSARIEKQVYLLEGLLPLESRPFSLSSVRTTSGRYADIHLIPAADADWILFLDATIEHRWMESAQQKENELILLRQAHSKLLDRSLCESAAAGAHVPGIREGGERGEGAVLCAGLQEIGARSLQVLPEALFERIGLHWRAGLHIIAARAGTVVTVTGSDMVAVFGLLPSTEPPPQLAARAAEQIIGVIKKLNENGQTPNTAVFQVGIGLAAGTVSLGLLDNVRRRILLATGPPVDLARKLQSHARANEILLDGGCLDGARNCGLACDPATPFADEAPAKARFFSCRIE